MSDYLGIPDDHKLILDFALSILNKRNPGFEVYQFILREDGDYHVSVRCGDVAYGFIMARRMPHFITAIEAIDMALYSNRWHSYDENGKLVLPDNIQARMDSENRDVRAMAKGIAEQVWHGYVGFTQERDA